MHGSDKLPRGRGLCTMCDQCRATSSLSHPITGWTLTRLTDAAQSSFCSLAATVSHVARERWLEVFWILLMGSRHRNAHWDLWNRTIVTLYWPQPSLTAFLLTMGKLDWGVQYVIIFLYEQFWIQLGTVSYRGTKVRTVDSPAVRSVNKSHDTRNCVQNEPKCAICVLLATRLYYKALGIILCALI